MISKHISPSDMPIILRAAEAIVEASERNLITINNSRRWRGDLIFPSLAMPDHIPVVDWTKTVILFDVPNPWGTEGMTQQSVFPLGASIQLNGVVNAEGCLSIRLLKERMPILVHELTHLWQFWKDPVEFTRVSIEASLTPGLYWYFNRPWEVEAYTMSVIYGYEEALKSLLPSAPPSFYSGSTERIMAAAAMHRNEWTAQALSSISDQMSPESKLRAAEMLMEWNDYRHGSLDALPIAA